MDVGPSTPDGMYTVLFDDKQSKFGWKYWKHLELEEHKLFSRYSSKTAFVDFAFLYFIFVLTSSQLPDILNISYYVFFWNKETQPRKIEHANIQHISLGLWQSPIPWSLVVLIAFICALRNLLYDLGERTYLYEQPHFFVKNSKQDANNFTTKLPKWPKLRGIWRIHAWDK